MPWERPKDKFGTFQGHPGRLDRFMWKFIFKGQNVRGTDGTDDGTDGTCPRDRRDTNQGVSRQNSLCLLVLFFRSGKLQNESSPNFSIFCPEFCPEFCSEFSPNFSWTFRALFRGRRRPEKIHQKSPPFFNAKFPGKHEKNIHKILLESRQSNFSFPIPLLLPIKRERESEQNREHPSLRNGKVA